MSNTDNLSSIWDSTTLICAEYIWIGGNGELRSKTRTLNMSWQHLHKTEAFPIWNYDGSSTDQADSTDSEVILYPCAIFNDPFRGNNNKFVMCYAKNTKGESIKYSFREKALEIFNKKIDENPWYGLEQEYFLIDPKTNKPLGFPEAINNAIQGQYYCSVGSENAFGRNIAEEHLQRCIEAGVKISGMNAEVAPGQWEFQIGPCVGIDQGDHMYVARYILQRVAERCGIKVSLEPKPIEGDWNGSGCHINFSTENMRNGTDDKTGLEYIEEAIKKLAPKHKEHMEVYGIDNDKRMTGAHETSSYNEFSDGVANRGASVRRGNNTIKEQKGYFEDRRPASNCDPYLATSKLFETCIL